MERNALKFISLFNEIEQLLRELAGGDRYMPFYKLVDQVSFKNKVVARYASTLKMYADLRNVIIHNQIDNRFIADPDDAAVSELEAIFNKIQSPVLAISVVHHQVQSVTVENALSKALELMTDLGYSQLPVYEEGKFVGMLNAHVITFWLAHKTKGLVGDQQERGGDQQKTGNQQGQGVNNGDMNLNITTTTVKEVMVFKTDKGKTLFLPRMVSAIEVLDQYQEFAKRADRIDAIMITHSGQMNETPLTIITDFDIPILLGCL